MDHDDVADYLDRLDRAQQQRPGRGKALLIGALTGLLCLTVAGGAPVSGSGDAESVAGTAAIPVPPPGPSWAPAPVRAGGLRVVATAGAGFFRLHTAGGDACFLPGVSLGSSTPGHQPGEFSVSAAQYRSWFAAMSRLGLRAVRIPTVHPPAFYRELDAHNRAHPTGPLYLVQGVQPPGGSATGGVVDAGHTETFRQELRDAAGAVAGELDRAPAPGRPGGRWDTDATAWVAAWVIDPGFDGYAVAAPNRRSTGAPAATGRYFRSTAAATPTERWLAARMDELAARQAARGYAAPIGFVNRTDVTGLDANHVRATAEWPAGTFAGYPAYPYHGEFPRPELQRHGSRHPDPYAGYLRALRSHHGDVPVMITEFGVPSSLGNARPAPLGRAAGDHSELQAMRINAELLRVIAAAGMSGGFLAGWADEWYRSSWNTDGARRQLWHDPLTGAQHAGLVAMDPTGPPGAAPRTLLDAADGWPARRVTARVDEAYLHLRIVLGDATPGLLTVGLDVLPALTGAPAPGAGERHADAAFVLDLVARTGQAYLRRELDRLDPAVPAALRGPQPAGWRRFQLVVNRARVAPATGERLPAELQDAGVLRYGRWEPRAADDADVDSRALWRRDGDDLVVRVPWAMAGFADPSAHRVAVPGPAGVPGTGELSPGVSVSVSATGTDQRAGTVTWEGWRSVGYTARLKRGARLVRDAVIEVTRR